MTPKKQQASQAERFSSLYDAAYVDVVRFLKRRTSGDVAEDVAHEVFVVAWKRFEDVPPARDEARAWLFGTARNYLLREWREQGKREELGVRLAEHAATALDREDSEVAGLRVDLAAAWLELEPGQQEVLSLSIWDELPSSLAGRVLDISPEAYRVRLHRARAALRAQLEGHAPTTLTTTNGMENRS